MNYEWAWQQGDGPHVWLRDISGRLARERGLGSGSGSNVGYIEPGKNGWLVAAWQPHEAVATLPDTLTEDEVKAIAKTILLSLKESP